MLRKIIVAILSTLILSFVLAYMSYTPESEREPNALYTPFSDQVLGISIYSGPVFLFGGVPLSLLIDVINRRIKFSSKIASYLSNLLLYALAAVPAIFGFVLVLSGSLKDLYLILDREFLDFLLFGMIASLLYYHVLLLTIGITKMLKSLKK